MSDYYCTRAEVKSALGIKTTDTVKDDLIDTYLPLVKGAIDDYCQRVFAKTTYTGELYDGDGSSSFYVDNYPVSAVTSLIDDWDNYLGAGTTDLGASTAKLYNFKADTGEIYLDPQGHATISAFSAVKDGIKITYDAGYVLTAGARTLPATIVMVAIELTALWTGLKIKTYITAEGITQAVQIPGGKIPEELRALLEPYVRRRLR